MVLKRETTEQEPTELVSVYKYLLTVFAEDGKLNLEVAE